MTDRLDLEDQLAKNFMRRLRLADCDAEGRREGQGELRSRTAKRIGSGTERIILTLVHKFNAASQLPECYNPSSGTIVLVDEGHRSHGGESHERMRNGCSTN